MDTRHLHPAPNHALASKRMPRFVRFSRRIDAVLAPVAASVVGLLAAGCTTILGEDFAGYQSYVSTDPTLDAGPEGAAGPVPASCTDGRQNDDETDTDCGGTICRPCLADRACSAGPDCVSGSCVASKCDRSVTVTDPDGVTSYGIDATEVTQRSYAAFLAATAGDTSGQASACSWNSSFEPSASGNGCATSTYAPATSSDLPVTCVDWCDATAYCAWTGMRLCGAISGGPTPYAAFDSASQSQWHNACSAGGTVTFPYGDVLDGSACNASEYGAGALVAVGKAGACHGAIAPLSHVQDLSGNAWEWEDSCSKDKNGNDDCRIRGGSFGTASAKCKRDAIRRRNTAHADVGFRCCT